MDKAPGAPTAPFACRRDEMLSWHREATIEVSLRQFSASTIMRVPLASCFIHHCHRESRGIVLVIVGQF
jgi:hypothetical protein